MAPGFLLLWVRRCLNNITNLIFSTIACGLLRPAPMILHMTIAHMTSFNYIACYLLWPAPTDDIAKGSGGDALPPVHNPHLPAWLRRHQPHGRMYSQVWWSADDNDRYNDIKDNQVQQQFIGQHHSAFILTLVDRILFTSPNQKHCQRHNGPRVLTL